MPTLSAAHAALERHCGFNIARIRAISRRLQEDGMLPLGGPGESPAIKPEHFAALFIATAVDPVVRIAPELVRNYMELTPAGVPLEGAPASIASARSTLLALIGLAPDNPDDFRDLQLEFVANWPELALHWGDGSAQRYQPTGTVPGYWQASGHRRSTTIPGKAFRDAVRAIFRS